MNIKTKMINNIILMIILWLSLIFISHISDKFYQYKQKISLNKVKTVMNTNKDKILQNYHNQKNNKNDNNVAIIDELNLINQKEIKYIDRILELEKEIGLKQWYYQKFNYLYIKDDVGLAKNREVQFISRIQDLENILGIEHKKLDIDNEDMLFNEKIDYKWFNTIWIAEYGTGKNLVYTPEENINKFPTLALYIATANEKLYIDRIWELEEQLNLDKSNYQPIQYKSLKLLENQKHNREIEFIKKIKALEKSLWIKHKQIGINNENNLFFYTDE